MITKEQWELDADKLIRMEERHERKAVAPLRTLVAKVLAMIDALWPGDQAPQIEKIIAIRAIERELATLPRYAAKVVPTLIASAEQALDLGLSVGMREVLETTVEPQLPFKEPLPRDIVDAADGAAYKLVKFYTMGSKLLSEATEKADVITAVNTATSGLNNVSMASRWMTNAAANEGAHRVAEQSADLTTLVRPERNGCVECLGKAGTTAKPPFHPRCRCTTLVLERESAKAVAEGLKREAERSILRGWSLPSESEAVRLKAARALLARGTSLPKSVQAYARTAINRGEFPRGRDFPSSS